MGRSILAVIAGYVVMAVLVIAGFFALLSAMGADWAFKPGTYQASTRWALASCVIGLAAAIIGGFVCARISTSQQPPRALAVFVFVMGIAFAIPILTSDAAPMPRLSGATDFEKMGEGVQPAWVALLNPVIGAVGVLIGARLRKRPG